MIEAKQLISKILWLTMSESNIPYKLRHIEKLIDILPKNEYRIRIRNTIKLDIKEIKL